MINAKPQSRKENIVIQELENELLIYDLKINKAFSLNETCSMVWAECDGEKSIAEMASILSRRTNGLVNEEVVWLALETLQKENLLTNKDVVQPNFNGMSRRQIIRKVGFASLVAIPIITSLVAPTAINAQSRRCANPGAPVGFQFQTSGGFAGICINNTCPVICQSEFDRNPNLCCGILISNGCIPVNIPNLSRYNCRCLCT